MTDLIPFRAAPMAIPVMAQEEAPAPINLVLMGSGFYDGNGETTDGIKDDWGAGFKIGLDTKIGAGLTGRLLYNKIKVGAAKSAKSLQATLLREWYVGKQWGFYLTGGTENYIEGSSGIDMVGGFGASRVILTDKSENYKTPLIIRGFAEILFTDAEDETSSSGNFAQINLGITISKPSK